MDLLHFCDFVHWDCCILSGETNDDNVRICWGWCSKVVEVFTVVALLGKTKNIADNTRLLYP